MARIPGRIALSSFVTLSFIGLTACKPGGPDPGADDSEAMAPAASITAVDLRAEGKLAPLGVPPVPDLSWRVESDQYKQTQSAWQIRAASSPELLADGKADLWDSGKTPSQRSPLIAYAGEALKSGQICHWQVRVWDGQDRPSAWSPATTFEVAPVTPGDWSGAKWIDDGKENPSKDEDFYKPDPNPLFRKAFHLDKPIERARLHVVGLGLCYPSLNGARLDDHLFDPPWTDFEDRIFFRTLDVTEQVAEGSNCLGLEVGNGFFNPLPLRKWGRRNLRTDTFVGRPRVIAKLVVTHPDGSESVITTGDDWKTTEGRSLKHHIYIGEVRDARIEHPGWNTADFDDSDWRPARVNDASLGPLQPLKMLPVRARDTLQAVALTEPKEGTWIVDYGVNFSGIPEIDFDVPAGTRITLRFGELLYEDGTLNPMTSVTGQIKGMVTLDDGTVQPKGGPGAPEIAWQEDIYIAKGGGESYTPDFTYHAFRFMEVTGLPEAPKKEQFRAIPFNTELAQAGKFECSNELLNRIQQLCLNTFHANVVAVQSDCPHRERFGYGGDIVATSETFLMNFDMEGFYNKTVLDWQDAQLENKLMPDTAPYAGVKYCGVGWGMAHPILVEQLYRHYGDKRMLEWQLPVALSWIEAEAGRREDGLVVVGLGDHEALIEENKGSVLTTPKFIASCKRIARLARISGNEAAAERCEAWAAESQAAWQKAYLDTESGKVGVGKQTQQAFALGFDAVPEKHQEAVFGVLVDKLTQTKDHPRLSTGIYGTWKMLELLPEFGRNDLAYGLATRETMPSWGWMLENDATTLWENWEGSDNTYSNNHPMFGSVSGWFFRWLGGIQCAPEAVGFDRIVICPRPVEGLEWVKSSHDSIRGTIVSNWKKTAEGTEFEITIPANTTAKVELPAAAGQAVEVLEGPEANFEPSESQQGIHQAELGSGKWRLMVGKAD
ncbi:MAG: family 78 glycoside hydrolase catalytic domain [Akkermansiaceae bacterium]|nr:family 78 glycoside hydrolase catalytic domain [Akkermansiaceae bacterium]